MRTEQHVTREQVNDAVYRFLARGGQIVHLPDQLVPNTRWVRYTAQSPDTQMTPERMGTLLELMI